MVFNKDPKVSIITVCLNSEKYVERTIQSVLSQSYKHIEYIVLDGKSTDGTLEILNKYRNRVSYLISETDNGIYDAMNKGIRLATGDFLNFLNSDDRFYDTDIVEKVISFLKKNKGVDFIYGNLMCFNPTKSEVYLKKYPRVITKRYFLRSPLGHPSTFYHKDCFKKAGLFDSRYKISADYEWYLRALFRKGLKAAYINETICIFQEGGKSSNDNLRLSETGSVLKLYFNPVEMHIGKFFNCFFHVDLFRFISRVLLNKKGYRILRSLYRKFNKIRH